MAEKKTNIPQSGQIPVFKRWTSVWLLFLQLWNISIDLGDLEEDRQSSGCGKDGLVTRLLHPNVTLHGSPKYYYIFFLRKFRIEEVKLLQQPQLRNERP